MMINTIDDLCHYIGKGEFDDHLDELAERVSRRKTALSALFFSTLKVGDKVMFNERTRPKYLQGATATVVELNRTRAVVDLDAPIGKFEGKISTTPALIELVLP